MSSTFTGAYRIGYGTPPQTLQYKVTVPNGATKLEALITPIPYDANAGSPKHVLFQVPAAASNPIYIAYDGATTPVAGGPGIELAAGASMLFDNEAGLINSTGAQVPVSQFNLIATADTVLLVNFFY
jgi:hypothetical protein